MKEIRFRNYGSEPWHGLMPNLSQLKEGDVIGRNASPLGKAFGEVRVIKFVMPRNKEMK